MAPRCTERIVTVLPAVMVGSTRLGYTSPSGTYPRIIRMAGQLVQCCRDKSSGLHVAMAVTSRRTRTSREESAQELRWDPIHEKGMFR